MFFTEHPDLFSEQISTVIEPWEPVPLNHASWPPDYRAVYSWRMMMLDKLRNDQELLADAIDYYRTHKAQFVYHWIDTYNPRKKGVKWVPFVFFERQAEFFQFVEELDRDEENGLIEKARDIGATWLACAYSVTCFLFDDDDATGWGSRKQDLVDKIGDPDSIFEKMRLILRRLPEVFRPHGFSAREHATFMKLINPANGSTITGESGDNIGRGGRKARYWKDESAHYERAEKIESALGDNTNVQIDISSVNGLGNVFHRRREAGMDWSPGKAIEPGYTRVFVFDWRDHPEKDQAWYDQRKAKAVREGMQHIFAQEVDRDYAASQANRIIDPEWIAAAIDAHITIPYMPRIAPQRYMAGLDVADGGIDRNALALRQWIILRDVEEWGERDPGVTMRRAHSKLRNYRGIHLQYDSIGVGAGVKTEYNRLIDDKILTADQLRLIAWNAGAKVVNPYDRVIPGDDESELNKDFYGNFKAQAWLSLGRRFYKTWRAVMTGEVYPVDELISLDSACPMLAQVRKELAQPVSASSTGLRTIVDKAPEGTKSPNLADSIVMAYFPAPDVGGTAIIGGMRG